MTSTIHSGSAGDPPAPQDGRGWHSRGYLPHFDQQGLTQLITFRLADSLPRSVVDTLRADVPGVPQPRARLEQILDRGHGSCFLRVPAVARTVESTLLRFDGKRYRLLAWVIMPNHVHVLVETSLGSPLSGIVHSWKSYTAKEANRLLHRTGRFWQPEYFDRAIRDEHHLVSAIEYVENNPVKAGLASRPEAWPFGSAACARPTPGRASRPRSQDASVAAMSRRQDPLWPLTQAPSESGVQ